MSAISENRHGYLLLAFGYSDCPMPLLLKANKITAIVESNDGAKVYIGETVYDVHDSMEDILEQIEDIHPSLR